MIIQVIIRRRGRHIAVIIVEGSFLPSAGKMCLTHVGIAQYLQLVIICTGLRGVLTYLVSLLQIGKQLGCLLDSVGILVWMVEQLHDSVDIAVFARTRQATHRKLSIRSLEIRVSFSRSRY